ncbi:MAG: TIGR02206 family membrane protein [Candidatus Omnitrophica bacterium]|nr:TIGR02206 family membrane protein [Candidatus Omnitrophota bacterium]
MTSEMRPFRLLGTDHGIVLVLTLLGAVVLLTNARRIRGVRNDRVFRYIAGIGLAVNELFAFLYFLAAGILVIPLQFCDLAVFLMIGALLGRNRYVREIAFFWGLAGSSQAVLTPALTSGLPDYVCVQFFLSHCTVVLSAIYLAVKGMLHLSRGSVLRAWLMANVYAGVVGVINWRFGMNLGFLAAKPDPPSLLDYLGPWPYYIFWEEFVALGLFFICFLFARLIDRLGNPSRPSRADNPCKPGCP